MPKAGYITASSVKKLMVASDIKADKFGVGANTYAKELASQRLGTIREDVSFKAAEWGNEYEWLARETYEVRNLVEVVLPEVFCVHPKYDFVGGTPDGLVGSDGIIEIKCPENPVLHEDNFLNAEQYHSDYRDQCQFYLWICERQWVDFVSFDPRQPEWMQLSQHRFVRDKQYIALMESRVLRFEHELVRPRYKDLVTKGLELGVLNRSEFETLISRYQ